MSGTRRLLILSVSVAVSAMIWALASASDGQPDLRDLLNEKKWPAFLAEHQLKDDPKDNDLSKLLKERYAAAQNELRSRYTYWLQNADTLPQVCDAAAHATLARLEADGQDNLTVLKEKLEFAKLVEQQADRLAKTFNKAQQLSDVKTAHYYRLNAEIELLRAETKETSK
jgi:hypothetical protein